MKFQADMIPVARVSLMGGPSLPPGWYVQHYVKGQLVSTQLSVEPTADAFDAVGAAASAVGCVPEQIQVEGAPWPRRRFPM